jgi:hypothetical protein
VWIPACRCATRPPLARGSVVDQRLPGLAQNLVLQAQTMDLTPLLAQIST